MFGKHHETATREYAEAVEHYCKSAFVYLRAAAEGMLQYLRRAPPTFLVPSPRQQQHGPLPTPKRVRGLAQVGVFFLLSRVTDLGFSLPLLSFRCSSRLTSRDIMGQGIVGIVATCSQGPRQS